MMDVVCPLGHADEFISLRGRLSLSGDEPLFHDPDTVIVDSRRSVVRRVYPKKDDWRLYACLVCGSVFLQGVRREDVQ